MLYDAGKTFESLVATLANRVKIELQDEGYAIIIDGEVYTWTVTEDKAYDRAIQLIELGV